MENWAYELRTLRGMAKHWKSGEPIDEATVHKLRSAKNYRAASMMLRQLKATSRVCVCVCRAPSPELATRLTIVCYGRLGAARRRLRPREGRPLPLPREGTSACLECEEWRPPPLRTAPPLW